MLKASKAIKNIEAYRVSKIDEWLLLVKVKRSIKLCFVASQKVRF